MDSCFFIDPFPTDFLSLIINRYFDFWILKLDWNINPSEIFSCLEEILEGFKGEFRFSLWLPVLATAKIKKKIVFG